jgi:uncharacterized membrane protein YgcG
MRQSQIVEGYRLQRTYLGAFPAVIADHSVQADFRLGAYAFGIGAPAARQWAALKEHQRPDARTIVQAELLNINDPGFHRAINLARCGE